MQRILTVKKSEKVRPVTFFSKEAVRCPVCDASFHREELFGGRVSADDLTDELHRMYKPLQAFGVVYPLAYEIEVCPSCFYAAFKQDFLPAGEKFADKLRQRTEARIESAQKVFSPLDYQSARGLLEGAASYFLSLTCYEIFSKDFAPTIKGAIASVRAAWLCHDLHTGSPNENWDYVAGLLYRKSRYFYREALELEQSGKEPYSTQRSLGPDTDKSYGHEGVLYMAAILELKYGPTDNPDSRRERLSAAKVSVARMFGFGKKNKAKPGPLLEKAKDLYERIKAELQVDDDDDD